MKRRVKTMTARLKQGTFLRVIPIPRFARSETKSTAAVGWLARDAHNNFRPDYARSRDKASLFVHWRVCFINMINVMLWPIRQISHSVLIYYILRSQHILWMLIWYLIIVTYFTVSRIYISIQRNQISNLNETLVFFNKWFVIQFIAC